MSNSTRTSDLGEERYVQPRRTNPGLVMVPGDDDPSGDDAWGDACV